MRWKLMYWVLKFSDIFFFFFFLPLLQILPVLILTVSHSSLIPSNPFLPLLCKFEMKYLYTETILLSPMFSFYWGFPPCISSLILYSLTINHSSLFPSNSFFCCFVNFLLPAYFWSFFSSCSSCVQWSNLFDFAVYSFCMSLSQQHFCILLCAQCFFCIALYTISDHIPPSQC